MTRTLFLTSLFVLVGCSSSPEATSSVTDSSVTTDGLADPLCSAPQIPIYATAGCSAGPTCAEPADTGCVHIVCGCDDKVHVYDCTGARAPFASEPAHGEEGDPCGDAGIEPTDAPSSDGGPCGVGKHEAFTTAGCSATPSCLPDGPEDACASVFCDCEGKTFSGACGYATKPFASAGACPDAGS